MLKELKRYDNLGTPKYFWELLQTLKKGDIWKLSDIEAHFYNRLIDDRQVFDGCIPVLRLSGVVSIEEETQEVRVNFEFSNLHSERMCQSKLLEAFLKALNKDADFHNIFRQSHFDYLQHKTIVVAGSAFGLKFVNLKRLLTDFGFLRPHPELERKFLVSSKWKKFADQEITPKVRTLIGIEALKEKIRRQEENGESAEKFILTFENNRLQDKEGIQWIAPYDSGAGFDVLSFHLSNDEEANRFIEVKSYVGRTPYFYWTRNEMKVAEQKKDDYYVYLVNRDEMNQEDYEPIMIPNPIESILKNDSWGRTIEKYYFIQK